MDVKIDGLVIGKVDSVMVEGQYPAYQNEVFIGSFDSVEEAIVEIIKVKERKAGK